MTIQDPLSDMFTRMRNSYAVKKPTVEFTSSKLKTAVLKMLEHYGYIAGETSFEKDGKPHTRVELKYYTSKEGLPKSVISSLKRVSKPSLRVYAGKDQLPSVNMGLGLAIISTSKGLMSSEMARKQGLGGEIVAEIY